MSQPLKAKIARVRIDNRRFFIVYGVFSYSKQHARLDIEFKASFAGKLVRWLHFAVYQLVNSFQNRPVCRFSLNLCHISNGFYIFGFFVLFKSQFSGTDKYSSSSLFL